MGSSGIKLGPPGHPISFLFLFWPCHAACGILVPRPGIEPGPSEVRMWHRPNSGPPRNSPGYPISNMKLNTYPHHKYTSHNLTIFQRKCKRFMILKSMRSLFQKIAIPKGNKSISLIAQLVKNPPAMQETPVQLLDKEDLLDKG